MSIATGIITASEKFYEETGARLQEIHLEPILFDKLIIEFNKALADAKMRPAYMTLDWLDVGGTIVRRYVSNRVSR